MKTLKYLLVVVSVSLIWACSKSDFLNKNPDISHVVPTTLAEFNALLDRDQVMNGMGSGAARGPVPHIGEASADDYFVIPENFQNLNPQFQNYYTWKRDVYDGSTIHDWNRAYETVLASNVVLEGIKSFPKGEHYQEEINRAEGTALFHRAHAFYQLAQVFAPPYSNDPSSLFGIPLRLNADMGEDLHRSTLDETYMRIIIDLQTAAYFLPKEVAVRTRPTKQAVFGLLSRVFLVMGDYSQSLLYADSCLQIQSSLLDYNLVDKSPQFPFQSMIHSNPEILFLCNMQGSPTYSNSGINSRVPEELYNSYDSNDLRKEIFFMSTDRGYFFRGNYSGGSGYNFAGLTTAEVYLNKAECYARLGDVASALKELNYLLEFRWDKKVGFEPFYEADVNVVLGIVLSERRKELVARGTRWSDLRRWNNAGNVITLKRKVGDMEYRLLPNDSRYTLPIPYDVMAFHPDWPQNQR